MDKANLNNIERFSGFTDTYDAFRPEAPEEVCHILTDYLGEMPRLVIDLGCGTGLSTMIWQKHAHRIIGIEPNDDMRRKAVEKLACNADSNVSFSKGYSHETGLMDQSVDIITCSQSFHWMDPQSTLAEADRILKDGGIFAAYDCDWPPSVDWVCEKSYEDLLSWVTSLLDSRLPEEKQITKRSKAEHLGNMQKYGKFRFAREVVFHKKEYCDARRFIGIALSQGGIQSGLKHFSQEAREKIKEFADVVERRFKGETRDLLFGYRLRFGVK